MNLIFEEKPIYRCGKITWYTFCMEKDEEDKYHITFSRGALKLIDEMTDRYRFEDREKTLQFALYTIKKLQEDRNVSLRDTV